MEGVLLVESTWVKGEEASVTFGVGILDVLGEV
jgi:hypothetical protein